MLLVAATVPVAWRVDFKVLVCIKITDSEWPSFSEPTDERDHKMYCEIHSFALPDVLRLPLHPRVVLLILSRESS